MPINQYGVFYNEADGDPSLPGSDPRSAYAKQQAKVAAQQDAARKAQQAQLQATTRANDYRTGKGPGVFTLDQLNAMGQTGDTKTDWMASGPDASGPIAGGGNGMIDPSLNLPAGYYQLPNMGGQAYYYDPHSGEVSKEFSDWANSGNIARDASGKPIALMSGADSGEVFRASPGQSATTLDTLNKIISGGRGADGTYQDSQDKVLGIGSYQQFVTGKDGKQIRIQDTPNYQALLASGAMGTPIATGAGPTVPQSAAPEYTDLSSSSTGAFDRLLKKSGQTSDQLDQTLNMFQGSGNAGFQTKAKNADFWTKMEDSLAANYETNTSKAEGLQALRVSRGLDPNTGTSAAERDRISSVYASIQDPAERAAYLRYQDPGNLTPELRALNRELKAPEREWVAKNQVNTHIYDSARNYGGPSGVGVDVTLGSQTFTDPTTGRDIVFGNVPIHIEAQPKYKQNTFEKGLGIVGGAIGGAMFGFFTGGPLGAIMGAYAGVGAPAPNKKNISFSNAKGWGEWKTSSRPGESLAQMYNIKSLGAAILFARLTGSGMYGSGFDSGASGPTGPTGYGGAGTWIRHMAGK